LDHIDGLPVRQQSQRKRLPTLTTTTFDLPTQPSATPVQLRYLEPYSAGGQSSPLGYIQRSRLAAANPNLLTPDIMSGFRTLYETNLPRYIDSFSAMLSDLCPDVIAAPPSDRQDAMPFIDAARTRFPHAEWVGNWFSKTGNAGVANTAAEYLAGLSYAPGRDVDDCGTLLLVDDSLARGFSAAAVLHRLREAGMIVVATVVCVPLWIDLNPSGQ
jgi:hypothetical protein